MEYSEYNTYSYDSTNYQGIYMDNPSEKENVYIY